MNILILVDKYTVYIDVVTTLIFNFHTIPLSLTAIFKVLRQVLNRFNQIMRTLQSNGYHSAGPGFKSEPGERLS
jgi:hypothetical protein